MKKRPGWPIFLKKNKIFNPELEWELYKLAWGLDNPGGRCHE